MKENLKRDAVEMLLLTLLIEEDMYGYQLSQELTIRSQGLFQFQEGSMYPTLYRMIDKKLVSDRKETIGKRRVRVYYHIEPKGVEYLCEIKKEYEELTRGIINVMNYRREESDNTCQIRTRTKSRRIGICAFGDCLQN